MDEFQKNLNKLHEELVMTFHYYRQFQALFDRSEIRSKLLVEAASEFFDDVFWLFLDRIVLGICRTTDPAAQGRNREHKNLTFSHLVDLAKVAAPQKVAELKVTEASLRKLGDEIRPWRKKLIAHLDRDVALQQSDISRSTSKSTFSEFFVLAERFFSSAGENPPSLEAITQGGDANTLVFRLKEAMAFEILFQRDPCLASSIQEESAYRDS